ncbi:MAG: hypothetical protein ACE5HZ_07465 [Fidelibacterota bacterium]
MKKRLAFLISGGALLVSILLPYLFIVFTSPQYADRSPKMYLYAHGLEGDLRDWEVVGRYIGVDVTPRLPELDLNIVSMVVAFLGVLTLTTAFLGKGIQRAVSISLVTAGLLLGGWTQYRLYQQGHRLDPNAPMRTVVQPFTPPLIGVVKVSKITIYHLPHLGSALFVLACGLTLYAAWRKSG